MLRTARVSVLGAKATGAKAEVAWTKQAAMERIRISMNLVLDTNRKTMGAPQCNGDHWIYAFLLGG
jgi:hypothetical protein